VWLQPTKALHRDLSVFLRQRQELLHDLSLRHKAPKDLRQIAFKATELVLAAVPPESREGKPLALTPAQAGLRKMVLDAVVSPHSKRNYARALDDLFAFCASRPLSRFLLME
jgi:hypothetical protein